MIVGTKLGIAAHGPTVGVNIIRLRFLRFQNCPIFGRVILNISHGRGVLEVFISKVRNPIGFVRYFPMMALTMT